MNDVTRVVLAIPVAEVAEEILHFLDRSGRARVVATAEDDAQLVQAIAQFEPDAVVAEPQLASRGVAGVPLLALAPRETVTALRAAVRAGARGFYLWPAERDGLLVAVDAARADAGRVLTRRATVVSVHAARGGAGATFVATHLAQAFSARGASCRLIDLDRDFADLTHALGAEGDDIRTVADLVPVADELTAEHLDEVTWRGAILGPPADAAATVEDALLRRVVEVAAASADVVITHTPHALAPITRWAFETADRPLQVLTLDVFAFRATARTNDLLGVAEPGIVVNRAARSEVTVGDVRRVFGVEPLAVLPADAGVPRAHDHAALLPPKGRMGRAFGRLADRLVERTADEAA